MLELLPRARVEELTGLSTPSIYRLMKVGEFPRPVRIGQRAVRWRREDVDAWLSARPAMPELLTRASIEEQTGFSCATIYRLMKTGDFPRPVKMIGQRATCWRREDLDAWLSARPVAGGGEPEPETRTAATG